MRSKALTDVEILYESGETRFVYSCYLAMDTVVWVMHGTFKEFYKNGKLASEGIYYDGLEDGRWLEYHPSGQLASDTVFELGKALQGSQRWLEDGTLIK